jgi:hypothetical protein
MANNVIESLLRLSLDKSAAAQSLSAVDKLAAALKSAGTDGAAAMDATTAALQRQAAQVSKTAGAFEQYEGQRRAIDEGGGGFAGDVASSTAGIRGALDALTGGNAGAAGQILEIAEAVADLGEFAPKAAAQVGTFANVLIANTGLIGSAAGKLPALLGGAISAVTAFAGSLPVIGTALTAVGATASGVAAAMLAALGPIGLAVAGIAALAAAVSVLGNESAKQAELINRETEAKRKANDFVGSDTTSAAVIAELERLKAARAKEADLLTDLQGQYQERAAGAGLLSGAWQALAHEEEALVAQIDTSGKSIAEMDAYIAALEERLNDGTLAANDAALAEEELSARRTEAALSAADAAGREIDARNRADRASAEQNEARLSAIADERESLEAQLNVLRQSGATSDEVTARIAALTAELNALGSEASYIESSALGAAKAREAQKKAADESAKAAEEAAKAQEKAAEDAAREAERRADEIVKAQEDLSRKQYEAAQKYSDALVDIARKAADDAEKSQRQLQDTLSDNERDFGRDITQMSLDFQRSEREQALARQDEEVRDLRGHQRRLEQLRDDAVQSEQDALRAGDFLAAARIREKASRDMEAEGRAFQEAQAEKAAARAAEDAQELRELEVARQDRLTALRQQNDDARAAYQRDLREQRESRRIAEREASIARDRELRAAREAANAILGIRQQTAQQEINMLQGIGAAAAQLLSSAGTRATPAAGAASSSSINNSRTMNGNINIPINGGNPADVRRVVLQTIGEIGLA